jgi:hypothetical protein
MAHLCISLSLGNNALSQFLNHDFTTMCVFGGRVLAGNSSGIHLLDEQETDDGDIIPSLVEWPRTDFGVSNQKKLRKMYVGYKSKGDLLLKIRADEGDWEEFDLSENDASSIRQASKVIDIPRSIMGRYWEFAIENVKGVDFSVDHIQVMLVVLNRKIRTE